MAATLRGGAQGGAQVHQRLGQAGDETHRRVRDAGKFRSNTHRRARDGGKGEERETWLHRNTLTTRSLRDIDTHQHSVPGTRLCIDLSLGQQRCPFLFWLPAFFIFLYAFSQNTI
jgi:hypothetical protein